MDIFKTAVAPLRRWGIRWATCLFKGDCFCWVLKSYNFIMWIEVRATMGRMCDGIQDLTGLGK